MPGEFCAESQMPDVHKVAGGSLATRVWSAGTFTTGGVVSPVDSSVTVTVNTAVPIFPAASVAVQVTFVVPTGKLDPEGGEQVGPEVTPILSNAVTLNVLVAPAE